MLRNRQVLLLKVEATYNVDPTPTNVADAILVENLNVSDSNARSIERPVIEASLGTRAHVFGGRLKEITFDAEVKGSGAAGTAPEIGQALRGCGLGETLVASTSAAYSPVSTGIESVTIWRYLDGKLEKYTGARGEVSFTYETGNKIMASFTFTAHLGTASADTAIVVPTYDTVLPEPIIGVGFLADAYGAVIGSLSFSLSNTIAIAPNMNAADGFGEVRITKRDVQGSFDPEEVLNATNNFDSDYTSGTVMTLTTGAVGATAGNILTTAFAAIKYRTLGEGERDGVQVWDIGFGAAPSAGDDDVTLTFT